MKNKAGSSVVWLFNTNRKNWHFFPAHVGQPECWFNSKVGRGKVRQGNRKIFQEWNQNVAFWEILLPKKWKGVGQLPCPEQMPLESNFAARSIRMAIKLLQTNSDCIETYLINSDRFQKEPKWRRSGKNLLFERIGFLTDGIMESSAVKHKTRELLNL